MTLEKLRRGLQIQDELQSLKNQLKYLGKSEIILLSELRAPCSHKISDELVDINDDVTQYAYKKINERIAKYEKEFKNL